MRILPVLDLLGGLVVRGVAGKREEYRPIQSTIAADARPETVARALAEKFGFEEAYVADLDAIMFPPEQREHYVSCYGAIASTGLVPWIDAGIGDGAGRLLARRVRVTVSGRRASARPITRDLLLPGPSGGVEIPPAVEVPGVHGAPRAPETPEVLPVAEDLRAAG